ncbi:hypothetical protein [Pseudarthrobacter sp. BRE9]|uniref:hypothetical protein n=1 Tax=Pseudarthrobacter sp. BRE9 TaxID=2962582 RepID=UPI0028817F9A|nr:hypothetical protein [Pseudarthrobacter sp. BRE9]MDT0168086.1 hypothetical protein [Pseudarthrobacter sp. BRE9]
MRQMTKKNKIAAVAASAALVAVGGGAAYAYWSTTGSGGGTATASSGTTTSTIQISAAFADGLTPGASEDITYTGYNPNSSSTTVTLDSAVVTASGTCDASWFAASVPSTTTTIAAGATAGLGKGTLSFADTATKQDACKGATITVTVTSH